jgi:predicted dehydrogenase
MPGLNREFGLAVVGCGAIGRIRAELARDYPGIGWLGLCDLNAEVGHQLQKDTGADFFTTDFAELIARPEVDATIIATTENDHTRPILAAVEQGQALFIEKPLATNARESEQVLAAIERARIDAVIGYTQRFRRRFLAVKERVAQGEIGDVTGVVTRAFMNGAAPIVTLSRAQNHRASLTPMVVSGTHSLDVSMWLMAGKKPVSVYARSNDRVMSQYGTKDSTFGVWTMDDGTIFSMNISWALPLVWPGAVYGLEIGIVGTEGAIDIEDTHRDVILASNRSQKTPYPLPEGVDDTRHVEFLTSFPPGDIQDGQLWGPMREETNSWYQRVYTGLKTPHATPQDGHRNLVMTMAMDLSAKLGREVAFPVDLDELGEPED